MKAPRPTRVRSLAGSAGLTVDIRSSAGVTVVIPRGELSEAFEGESLSSRLNGDLVFDLSGVDRVTSFGVREWLSMLRGKTGTCLRLTLKELRDR